MSAVQDKLMKYTKIYTTYTSTMLFFFFLVKTPHFDALNGVIPIITLLVTKYEETTCIENRHELSNHRWNWSSQTCLSESCTGNLPGPGKLYKIWRKKIGFSDMHHPTVKKHQKFTVHNFEHSCSQKKKRKKKIEDGNLW